MNEFIFRKLNPGEIPAYTEEIFAILAGNMRGIQPTGNTYGEDHKIWTECAVPVMLEGKSTVILIFCGDNLCGYFQYSVKDKTFRMEDIQFKKEFQGSGLFAALFRYLIAIIPEDTEFVAACSGKNNIKSQEILKHLGLSPSGENKNGRSFYFKGDYKTLKQRCSGNVKASLSADETVAFIYADEEKPLLYDIESVVSVKSYDGEREYEYGRDYVVKNGKLALAAGTSIPVITPEVFYTAGDEPILKVYKPDGTESPCYFIGRNSLGKFQVRVTYTHKPACGIIPRGGGRYKRFLNLLESGRDVTVMFHGDSITYGADSSLTHNLPPFEPSFPIRFAVALARKYDYSVRFVLPEAENTYGGPFPASPEGKRGTVTLVNTAVGGWTSEDGVNHLDTHIIPQIKKYGCDLFVLGYGMNDGVRPPRETAANCEKIVRCVLSQCGNASVMLVSTMLPNPDALHGWNANQAVQEPELIKLSDKLNNEEVPCDVAKMTSVSAEILKRKKFIDITGNNINHPNDCLSRVYFETLYRTLTECD